MINFQEMISRLTQFWARQGCLVHQGYDLEVGAGTFNPATFLRCLGPEPYSAVYVEPCRRPKDGRYGENPNRVQFYHQMQVILKPSPAEIQDLYLRSLEAIGLDLSQHDIRFVHDDWENPTIGAWGLGWEVWADGMEVTQFTYFQAVGGVPVKPVSGELTYGLERLALYIQGVDSIFDLMWNDEITYGELYKRSEWEWSRYNFTEADARMWLRHFEDFEAEAKRLVRCQLPIPAYDFVIKASHAFNMLDARGVISVTERTGYMGRIRNLAKLLAESYLKSREEQNHPLLKKKATQPEPEISLTSTQCNPDERSDFLLEIGSEELPATFVAPGLQNLESQMRRFLTDNSLHFESIETYGTPRRQAVLVKGLVGGTKAQVIERKGPALHAAFATDGTPSKAGSGFFRSLKLDVVSLKQVEAGEIPELQVRQIKEQPYLFATLDVPGKSTRALLAEALPSLILKAEFPKKMRWGDLDSEYARPLRWIVALYGEEVIPFAVAGIVADRLSCGHRQLDPASFPIPKASVYLETVRTHKVMASIEERRDAILGQIKAIESEIGGQVLAQERVMAQVLHLVEWPFVTKASFDTNFLEAPQEVLISEMVEHQKYFPVGDGKGALLPYFLIVCNNTPTDLIRSGNQKALFPRLADGVFLYEEDLKTSLDTFNADLTKMTFQKELGSVWDKVERLQEMAAALHTLAPLGALQDVRRAAELSKADLASLLVGEFPELQGHIGAVYARKQGEKEEVATAIEEHWMPRGESAPLPQSPCGILISIADKLDNLISCFVLGLKPTSSSDPYALRRQGIGLIKILLEQKLHIPLTQILQQAFAIFVKRAPKNVADDESVLGEIKTFLLGRFRTILLDKGFAKDEVEALLTSGLSDCYASYQRISALQSFRREHHAAFLAVLEMYTRIRKIVTSQSSPIDPSQFQEPCEKQLFQSIEKIRGEMEGNDLKAFILLDTVVQPVTTFFEKVKVMDDHPKIRDNRLALLNAVKSLCEHLIDFSQLQED